MTTDEDEKAFVLLAGAMDPLPVGDGARARLLQALEAEPYLPFCEELAGHFDLSSMDMRAMLARLHEPAAWTRGVPPVDGSINFRPGPSLLPFRGGFVRMRGGARVPLHRHTDREMTFVLSGSLDDGDGRTYGPGSAIVMPEGSVHTLGVPEKGEAVLAILHGRIELLGV